MTSTLLAIDPGNVESGWVIIDVWAAYALAVYAADNERTVLR